MEKLTTKDGGGKMAKEYARKKKPIGKMILFGIISITLYVLLLSNQDLISNNFARGGLYALLPIAAAFLFSFAHGSFTGSFWTVLGVEAKKKKEVK
jgi:hypothetical protein